MTKTSPPLEWRVTVKVMLDDDGGARSLRDWLREHGGRCPKGMEAQLRDYVRAVLISNSDWDNVRAGFVVTEVTPIAAPAESNP